MGETMIKHEAIRLTAVMIFGTVASIAAAQETYATLIENDSTATIDAVPNAAVFRLQRQFAGDSLSDVVRDAQSFAPALRTALKEAGYDRATLKISGPMIPDAQSKSMRIDAEIRLGLGSSSAEGSRSTAFATAVDKVSAVAAELDCTIDGPTLDVGNRDELENIAVQRAIENAYTRAQAAATVMRLAIVSVDHVTIEAVTWHNRPDQSEYEASADRISVTVDIRIAYLALPPDSN